MEYEGRIFRPPSEADSLLIQVTVGCSWNRCTFCDMYKEKQFRVRDMEDIFADLQEGTLYRDRIRRIFLCDGDALALKPSQLTTILLGIQQMYPQLEGVRVYASARDVLRKSQDELCKLRELGLDMVYLGLESGSDRVLEKVDKGLTKQDMIDAAKMLRDADIQLSVSIIAGLGGEEMSQEHIRETADALNQMQPQYLGTLVLHVGEEAELYREVQMGSFRLPSPKQVLDEMEMLVELLEQEHCYFTSAHVSNYIYIQGWLPRDKERLLAAICQARRLVLQ